MLVPFSAICRNASKLFLYCLISRSVADLTKPTTPKVLYFTGGGIYYFWQAGAAQYIQENCNLHKVPVIGASAGSLTATLLLAGCNYEEATSKAVDIANYNRLFEGKTGLFGVWGGMIRTWLKELLPEDVEMSKFSNLKLSVTSVSPRISNKLVMDFKDRSELIDACMASCHIPFFLDGKAYTWFRGQPSIDGSLYSFITRDRRTGLPFPATVTPSEVFWVDYSDDKEFMATISGNFVQLISPEGAYSMMKAGYAYMRQKDMNDQLPFK